MPRTNSVRSLAATLACVAAIATGCAHDTIKVRSHDSITPAGRVSWQVVDPRERKWIGMTWSGLTVEGEIAYAEGKDHQDIDAGRDIAIGGGGVVLGPTTARTHAKTLDTVVDFRTGLEVADVFRLEPMLGLEVASIDLQVESANAQASERTNSTGVYFGVRAGLQPHEMIDFYTKAALGVLADKNKGAQSQRLEVGVRVLPFEHLGAFAGYRWIEFRQARDPDDSDAELTLNGPIFGLELRF